MHVGIFPTLTLESIHNWEKDSMYLRRTVERAIPSLCKNFKVLLVTGMRQVGKRTLLQQLSESERQYITLDNFEDFELASHAPSAFFKQHALPLTIDEIQRVPSLFRQVKAEVDKSTETGKVWISGSQRFSLMKNVGDSLAGRLFEVHLMPLSIYEREGKGLLQTPYLPSNELKTHLDVKSSIETWKIIWQGAWPKLLDMSAKERTQFFEAFVQTFLERDIRTLGNIEKLVDFRKFMMALAMRTGQELRINKFCEIARVSEPTVKRWLSVAEASGLIYLLRPFSTNATKTLTKSPKVYFCDTGLAAFLCGFSTPEEMHRDMNAGAFFETFVITEILKSWRHNGLEPDLYFYRNLKKQSEIDLLIHANGLYHPIEIKMSEQPNFAMTRHFDELKDLQINVGQGAVICNCPNYRYLKDDVIAHNLWQI